MMLGFEDARILSQHLLPAIPRDAGERIVDIDDRAIGGRDGDPLTRMRKNAGRQFELFFVTLARVDIGDDANQTQS